MNNIVHLKDIFQQWHHEQSISSSNTRECTKAATTTITAMASPTKAMQQQQPWTKQQRSQTIIKLADESLPARTSIESDNTDYDSFNEQETDYCRDSCDDLSNDGFEGYVLEYEVADSSASEDLHTDDGSSDDELIVAAAVASAIFDSSSSSDSDKFEIFAADADTEESDAPTDPELGRADYWTCIKCKNQKNNPMYRFCEKCYQIRKTHFPPRPKKRKKRGAKSKPSSPRNNKSTDFRSSSALSTHDDKLMDISADDLHHRVHNNSDGGSDDIIGNSLTNSMASQKHHGKHATMQRHKKHDAHSAGDSSCCSSQEMSPDEQQPTTYHSSQYLNVCPSSQSTYCSEIERIVDSQTMPNKINILESNYPNSISSQDSGFVNSQEFTTTATTQQRHHQLSPCIDNNNVRLHNTGNAVQVVASSSATSQASTISMDSQDNMKLTEYDSQSMLSQTSVVTGKQRKLRKRKSTYSELVCSDADSDRDSDEPLAKQLKTAEQPGQLGYGMCSICLSQPKDAAFLHNRFIHIYACYRCSVKVWNKRKKCPICNSQVKTVLKFSVY